MRKLARLALLFSLSFAIIFLASAGMRYLAIRLDWVKALSRQTESPLTGLIAAANWAKSLALYASILLGLGLAAREKIFTPAAVICIALLSIGFTLGISMMLTSWENVPAARMAVLPVGGPGLILSNSERPSSTAVVLLEGPARPEGARVVAIPGRPLQYQAPFAGRNPSLAGMPPAPFTDSTPWLLKSLAIDLRLSSENLRRLLGAGLAPFLVYAIPLILLLCSLSFVLKFSAWPLANLFLGCLAFRGILALETFFNSPEMQDVFDSFLKAQWPLSLAVPLIFCGIAILAYLYSFLFYLAKRRGRNEN
ncbi:MAG: hypothetical protein FWG46_04280 [Treponema sp.]|nr:hypothetical protein [Treponema sp.]